jgi:hypothetical protein
VQYSANCMLFLVVPEVGLIATDVTRVKSFIVLLNELSRPKTADEWWVCFMKLWGSRKQKACIGLRVYP